MYGINSNLSSKTKIIALNATLSFTKKKSNLNIQYKIWKNNYGLRKGNFQNSITIKQVEF